MNEITLGQSVPELIDQITDATLGDVTGANRVFIDEARIVLHGAIKALAQRPGSGGFFTRKELADTLHLPPREFAEFAVQGDPAVRSVIPSAFADGPLTRSDKAVLSIVAAVAGKLTA